jgi:four helix bundle protein
MTSIELQLRLKRFALRTVKVTESLPGNKLSRIIEDQLLRSAFSAAANYRAACKAISRKSFISKLSIAFEESDESLFWLEVIVDVDFISNEKMYRFSCVWFALHDTAAFLFACVFACFHLS